MPDQTPFAPFPPRRQTGLIGFAFIAIAVCFAFIAYSAPAESFVSPAFMLGAIAALSGAIGLLFAYVTFFGSLRACERLLRYVPVF